MCSWWMDHFDARPAIGVALPLFYTTRFECWVTRQSKHSDKFFVNRLYQILFLNFFLLSSACRAVDRCFRFSGAARDHRDGCGAWAGVLWLSSRLHNRSDMCGNTKLETLQSTKESGFMTTGAGMEWDFFMMKIMKMLGGFVAILGGFF